MVKTFSAQRMAAPFAMDGDDSVLPPDAGNPLQKRYSDEITKSHFALGGPEQVSQADIAYEQGVAAQRHRHAGRSQASNVILTDEVRWPTGPSARAHGGKSTYSQVQLNDQLPEGAGALPPAGYFYNAHGELHQLPAHAATAARSNMSAVYFGGNLEGSELAAERALPQAGRAQVASGRAQRSLVDAIVFGHQHGSFSDAEASLAAANNQKVGKRMLPVRQSRIDEAMQWDVEESPRGGRGEATGSAAGGYAPGGYAPPPHQYLQQQQQYQQPPPQYQPLPLQQQYQQQHQPPQQSYQPPPQQSYLQQPYHQAASGAAPSSGASGVGASSSRQAPGGQLAGQLLYDQEKRQWVTRDGQPARFDPLLRGGAVVRQQQPAAPPPRYQPHPPGAAQAAAAGGLRHPKLWMTSAQKAYGEAPMDVLPPSAQGAGPNARHGQFTRGFAPHTGAGGGFNM